VWNSANDDEASLWLRNLVEIPDGLSAQPILDQQIRLFTKQKQDELKRKSVVFANLSKVHPVMQVSVPGDP
jgi:hypothetical protein